MKMRKGFLKASLLAMLSSVCVSVNAQTEAAYGAYSPYSVFGIGNIASEGTAFNKSMGGVGTATRNRRYINVANPASVTCIDSSSFMLDFGLLESNKIYRQNLDGNKLKSANNTFNIADFVIAMPVYRSLAFMVGITPFSDLGYDFSSYITDEQIIGNTNNVYFTHYGEGSVYQIFFGVGVEFWKRLSVGAEMLYYFGSLDKVAETTFADASYADITAGSNMLVRAATAKIGVQYDQPLGRNKHLAVGLTYRFGTKMRGTTTEYQYSDQSSVRDTISYYSHPNKDGLKIGDELGIGVSYRNGEKWSVEVDYLRSDWSNSGMDNYEYTGVLTTGFTSSVSQTIRAGFEYVPNRNDIRYYMKRCSYRGGAYYGQDYYKYNGNTINSWGVTVGITLPVYRLYNGLTLGVDYGQKGRLGNDLIRETYITFNIGFNVHDLWFHKPKYD